jgi:hypothetical protein
MVGGRINAEARVAAKAIPFSFCILSLEVLRLVFVPI